MIREARRTIAEQKWVERDGRHAKNCVGSGLKNRLHGMAVKTLERLASLGMTVPRTEQTPFGSHNLRIDLVLYELIINRLVCVLDYACINPTNTRSRTAAAMESPGGAATQYEQVKHNHYGAAANEANLKVIPMVQDTHGAWGKEAKRTLRILFHRIARRFGQPVSAVARVWKTELQSLHEQRLANILLAVQERTPTIAAELGAETVEV